VQTLVQNNNSTPSTLNLPVLVPTRRIVTRGSTKGKLTTMHLEEVRDFLRAQNEKQQPQDHDRSFAHLNLDFTGGRVNAAFLDAKAGLGDKMLVHENAYRQMTANVLPARGGGFLLEQARLGQNGEKLSTMGWSMFARGDDKPRTFRTVLTRDADGSVRRMLRSQHSQGYATYDNLKFVEDMLTFGGDLSTARVATFNATDTGMMLRFVQTDGEIELNKPIPMFEALNSEVGCRKTTLRGGMWKLICTNGMAHWDKSSEWAWRHYGNGDRISRGVASAFDELKAASSGVIEAYNKSLDIAIDDAFAWLTQELDKAGASDAQVKRAQGALNDPTTTSGGRLASVVDAVTLSAQDETDLFEQTQMEDWASLLLRRGLNAAGNRERILVEA
jgi:hypothetical protein